MASRYSLKHSAGILLFWASVAISHPLHSTPHITGIDITPTYAGDNLLISYTGEIQTFLMTVDKEKHATLTISQATISPALKPNKYKGKLIKSLTLETAHSTDIKISIDFKRRLGKHSRNQVNINGLKTIQIELLDETAKIPIKPSNQSIIQPVVEPGTFELTGPIEKKPLDYKKDDRKKISTEEFLSLFETKIKPRPNRITELTYTLTHESFRLVLAMQQKPNYTLKSYSNPSMIKLKLSKTLGDFEITAPLSQHDFIGSIISTREPDDTLKMQADLYETTEISSKTIKNPDKPGYLFIINVKRIYPWETEAAIPDFDIR